MHLSERTTSKIEVGLRIQRRGSYILTGNLRQIHGGSVLPGTYAIGRERFMGKPRKSVPDGRDRSRNVLHKKCPGVLVRQSLMIALAPILVLRGRQ